MCGEPANVKEVTCRCGSNTTKIYASTAKVHLVRLMFDPNLENFSAVLIYVMTVPCFIEIPPLSKEILLHETQVFWTISGQTAVKHNAFAACCLSAPA